MHVVLQLIEPKTVAPRPRSGSRHFRVGALRPRLFRCDERAFVVRVIRRAFSGCDKDLGIKTCERVFVVRCAFSYDRDLGENSKSPEIHTEGPMKSSSS